MKKFLALLLCLVMAFAFVACDDKKKEEPDDDKGGSSGEKSSINYYVEYKGTKISLGADADTVLKALGTPVSSDDLGDCGGIGTQTKYTYSDSVVLYVVDRGSKKVIDGVTLGSDVILSPEKVGVGSTKDEVVKACGKGYSNLTDTQITYLSGHKSVIFSLRDGAVTKLEYKLDVDWYK